MLSSDADSLLDALPTRIGEACGRPLALLDAGELGRAEYNWRDDVLSLGGRTLRIDPGGDPRAQARAVIRLADQAACDQLLLAVAARHVSEPPASPAVRPAGRSRRPVAIEPLPPLWAWCMADPMQAIVARSRISPADVLGCAARRRHTIPTGGGGPCAVVTAAHRFPILEVTATWAGALEIRSRDDMIATVTKVMPATFVTGLPGNLAGDVAKTGVSAFDRATIEWSGTLPGSFHFGFASAASPLAAVPAAVLDDLAPATRAGFHWPRWGRDPRTLADALAILQAGSA